jgi:hypothetical protein
MWPLRPATADQIDNHEDDGDDQEKVDQSAGDVERETEQPEDEQNYGDGVEHDVFSQGLIFERVSLGEVNLLRSPAKINNRFLKPLLVGGEQAEKFARILAGWRV